LPSEQLGAGGVDSVRGYDERTADGSEGELVTAEETSASSLRQVESGVTISFRDLPAFISTLEDAWIEATARRLCDAA
jgi:hypothetical protein